MTIARIFTALNRSQGAITLQLKTIEHNLATDLQKNNCSQPQSPKTYAIDRIVGYKGNGASIRYKFQRYGYHPRDDNYKAARSILQHFTHRYWKRKPGGDQREKKPPCSCQPTHISPCTLWTSATCNLHFYGKLDKAFQPSATAEPHHFTRARPKLALYFRAQ